EKLKEKLDSYRPLPKEVLKNLHEDMVLRWTYNSNAIEGNTLTLKETKVALEGITIGGKTLREHFEVINHREAIEFIEELAKTNTLLKEQDIKLIHSLVLKNIDLKNSGRYRQNNVIISGAEHTPPSFFHLSEEMESFMKWYKTQGLSLHPVERAARVHVDFVGIHPFIDGNDRTARLLLNLELIKSGYPPIILKVEDKLKYYESLDLAHTKMDYTLFIKLILNAVEESFKPYFYALGVE
ncbi:MAG: Fic family protein, partial [Psychrilyobacter sp.]|nr:Fic family protein [Psychrilyobacter sp.]